MQPGQERADNGGRLPLARFEAYLGTDDTVAAVESLAIHVHGATLAH